MLHRRSAHQRTPSASAARQFAVAASALAILLTSCNTDDGTATPVDRPDTSTTQPDAPTSTTTTTEPIPEYRSFIAEAKADVAQVMIYDTPGGEQKKLDIKSNGKLVPVTIENPSPAGAPATFLVKDPAVSVDGEQYHLVYLPVRPNQSTGYVKDSDVTIFHTDLAVEIDLGRQQLSVFEAGDTVSQYSVAIGTDANPTPTGLFYVRELVAPTNSGYGPLAYSLSGHSRSILESEEFADGIIGVHGTNKPELIGQKVSHGCVRMENSTILDMASKELPLGTPVRIVN